MRWALSNLSGLSPFAAWQPPAVRRVAWVKVPTEAGMLSVIKDDSTAWAVQGGSCMYIKEAGGFDWMLCFSIITSLGSSALCFVYLDMNDHRFGRDRLHQAELAALFCYRTAELSARVTLLALFAVCRPVPWLMQ